jgi:predicted amidohydrolase
MGFFENDAGSIFNSKLIARPDESLRSARKHVLTASELFAEITPGHREREVVEINGVRCALIICADGGIEGLSEDLQRQGAERQSGAYLAAPGAAEAQEQEDQKQFASVKLDGVV